MVAIGDSESAEAPSHGPSAKGAFLLNMWAALRRIAGDAHVDAALLLMDPSEQREIRDAQAISWVRMATSSRFVDAVAKTAQLPAEKLYDDAVRMAVDLTYGGVWKVLLRFASAELLVKRSAMLYSKVRSIGSVRAEMVSGGANLELNEHPGVTDRQVRSLAVASARLLEIAGEKEVRFSTRMRPDGAVIQLRWGTR